MACRHGVFFSSVLICSWRHLLADRHSLPFPWTLSLHRRWCPSASHHPMSLLFLLALSFPLYFPFLSLGHPVSFLFLLALKGGGRGYMMRSPQGGLSAGMGRWKVVISAPVGEKDPVSGHTRPQKPPLGRGPSPPAWDDCLDALSQRRRQLPSSVWTQHKEVKQGRSRGSVGTTDQRKGKGRSGERPMGTTADGGKGQGKGKGSKEGKICPWRVCCVSFPMHGTRGCGV